MSSCLRQCLSFTVGLLLVGSDVGTEQAPAQSISPSAGRLVRSELSLIGRTASVTFATALRASDAANRQVVMGAADAARVRVGQLETNASLRVGVLVLGKDDPAGVRYDLWLAVVREGWQLQVAEAAKPGSTESPSIVGQVALSRRSAGSSSPMFSAALTPVTSNTGHLVLRWGEYEAGVEVLFTDPPRRGLSAEDTRPNVANNRTHDEDTSVRARALLLAQRNETALIVPEGLRLSVSFVRSFVRPGRSAGGDAVGTVGLGVEGPDFAQLMLTTDGSVVQLTKSAVPRLQIEAPLRFGNTVVRTGNHGPAFPGSYGIWLKRVKNGWRLVLNHEPDVWGSQHDPKFDVAEVPLIHSQGADASRPFAVAMVPTAVDRGRFVILWGPHEWTAEFAIAS